MTSLLISRGLALGAGLLLCTAPSLSAQELLRESVGDAAGVSHGRAAYVGDVNGDGRPEYAVAAPRTSFGTLLEAGRVELRDGATGATLWTFDGPLHKGHAGHALAGLHDVDGDAVPDLAVGAPAVVNTANPGRVYVLSGVDGSVINELVGGQPGGEFGWAVAGVADLDDDGLAELMVGAPSQDQGALDTGSVYLLDPVDGTVFQAVSGAESGDHVGRAVSGGSGSLAVNGLNRWHDEPNPIIGWHDEPNPIIGAPQDASHGRGMVMALDPSDGSLTVLAVGAADDDRLGSSLATLGDLDGDGADELLVGTDPRWSPDHPTGEGYLRLIDGAAKNLRLEREGASFANNFGVSAVGTGDVDGDGVPDYLVGEPLHDGAFADMGRVVLYSGADDHVIASVEGVAAGEQFGRTVAAVGDLDGDGLAEFAAAAPGHAAGAGALRIFTISPWAQAGGGHAGSADVPTLGGRGGLLGGHDVELELRGAPALAQATLVYGTTLLTDGDGQPRPAPEVVVSGLQTDADGALDHRFTWPTGMAPGVTTWFQVIVEDTAATSGECASAVLAGTTR